MSQRKLLPNTKPSSTYAELHCLTNFSFLEGASHPHELVAEAARQAYQALAITDECSLAGVVKAHVAAKPLSLKLIIGSSFKQPELGTLILLAPNLAAYQQLSALISLTRRRCDKGHYRLALKDLQHCKHCIAIWTPPLNGPDNITTGQLLQQIFTQQLWLGIHQLRHHNDANRYQYLYTLALALAIPMLACGHVLMHTAKRKDLQDILSAIRLSRSVDTINGQLAPNAEQHLRSLADLRRCYPDALLQETLVVANLCHFSLDQLRYQYPKELVPKPYSASTYLAHLVAQGCRQRWPMGVPREIQQQIQHELSLIKELRYEYYFLTVYDIVLFARSRNILCQGRGSAANSVVCYCLHITEVSPEQTQLLFERFISKERNEPPDIDVDFEHERREEVIQYIYKKYGRDKAALAASVISYRTRSAIRDVGKALGLDALFIDQLVKSLAWWDRLDDLKQRFKQQQINHNAERFMRLVQQIMGFPRHLSQHVGGFIITDAPISQLVPIENAAMPERTIIQWDKEDIEALGLLKVDVLGLGMLSAIRKSFELIKHHYQRDLSLATLPKEDPETYDMLCQGDSIGVFQVESRAQISMLPRLKPRCYYDLVIEVAIVRPGPIQGDMVHPYLRRREGSEPVDYPSEAVKSVLSRTLGIPIFQEQVIKLAMLAAGFSGGEADQLRRAMASWGRNGNLSHFKDKLLSGMSERGYNQDFAERLFKQMQGFGNYGFPESHAASFALLVYSSAWLKRHYPAAFYCALLNSQPMGFYSASQLVQDAKRHGIAVLPIDIQHSDWHNSLEPHQQQLALRLGLRQVKGLSQQAAMRVLAQRPFNNIQHLAQQADLNQHDISALINADATRNLSQNRYQGHWQRQAIETYKPLLKDLEHAQTKYHDDSVNLTAPTLFDNMVFDYNSTGLSLHHHPLQLLREHYPLNRCTRAAQLPSAGNKRFIRVAGVVTGRQRPGTASGVVFLTLEDETGNINIIVWKNVQQQFKQALLKASLLMVTGVIESKHGVCHVIAGRIEDLSHLLAQAELKSRDFH